MASQPLDPTDAPAGLKTENTIAQEELKKDSDAQSVHELPTLAQASPAGKEEAEAEATGAPVTDQPKPTAPPQIEAPNGKASQDLTGPEAPSLDSKEKDVEAQRSRTPVSNVRPRARVVWKVRMYRFTRVLTKIIRGVGKVIWMLIVAVGVLCLLALTLGLSFGVAAANGAIMMLIGNAIFRAAGREGFQQVTNANAAAVGAAGGALAALALGALNAALPCFKTTDPDTGETEQPWYIQMITTFLLGTLSGPIGASLLMRHHHDIGGLSIVDATRAGAVGGAIMGPGSIVLLPVIILVMGVVLSPLWIALMMGVEFIKVKSSETWTENSHSYSVCYCVGTCGDDPEIQEELERIEGIKRRHNQFKASSDFNNGWASSGL